MSKPFGRHTSKSRLIGVSDNVVEPTLSESNVDDILHKYPVSEILQYLFSSLQSKHTVLLYLAE